MCGIQVGMSVPHVDSCVNVNCPHSVLALIDCSVSNHLHHHATHMGILPLSNLITNVHSISLCLNSQSHISQLNPNNLILRSHVSPLSTNVAPLCLMNVDTCVPSVDECIPACDSVSIHAASITQ